MIECIREQVVDSHLDERLAIRSLEGWNFVQAVVHPFLTEEASPLWVVFWERTT